MLYWLNMVVTTLRLITVTSPLRGFLLSAYQESSFKSGRWEKMELSEGIIRIKFQMADRFIDGYQSMLDVRLEMK